MKSLKYLHLNFELPYCEYGYGRDDSVPYVDLELEDFPIIETSLSNLETIIIGGKLLNSRTHLSEFSNRYP